MAPRKNTAMVNAQAAALITMYSGCFINLYTGTRPADPDSTEGATLLATVTVDNDGTTGLVFVTGDSAGEMKKSTTQNWMYEFVAAGTVGWARVYDSNHTTGGTITNETFDITVGVSGSGADLILSTTTGAVGDIGYVQSFIYRIPKVPS